MEGEENLKPVEACVFVSCSLCLKSRQAYSSQPHQAGQPFPFRFQLAEGIDRPTDRQIDIHPSLKFL